MDETGTANKQHINYEERKLIQRLLRQNTPKKQIARLLHRNISTIRREIKKGAIEKQVPVQTTSKRIEIPLFQTKYVYKADLAQRTYEKNRQNCGAKCKIVECRDFLNYVEGKVRSRDKWSLDAAAGAAKAEGMFGRNTVCTQTLYNWVDRGLCAVKNIDLPLKVRRRPHKDFVRRHKRLYGKSIDDRPSIVDSRLEFGHWEGDGIVGKNGQGHLITLVERKTGMGILINVGDRKAVRIVEVLDNLERQFGPLFSYVFKSITFDNGVEFASSKEMEREDRTQIYYAHPYSAWERGTNENWNGIVRRYIPKGSSFDRLTDKDMVRIQHSINTLPRKRFGYRTPQELFIIDLQNILEQQLIMEQALMVGA